MKFALFEFCEDSSCAIGKSDWIVDQDESTFNNEDWLPSKEILVHWPKSSKEYGKWANKNGKSTLDSSCEMKAYAARVLKFNDQYDAIRKLMTTYLSTATTQTPLRRSGKRESKKNDRYASDSNDEEIVPPKKLKTKRKAISNTPVSESHNLQLKQKLTKEKERQSEDYSRESSDESVKDDGEYEPDVDANEMKRQIRDKDSEIEELKKAIEKMKDMQNLNEVVAQLKDSVREVRKLSPMACRCREKKISVKRPEKESVQRPEKESVQQRRPSPPLVHAIKTDTSSNSSSENEPDSITLCTGIEIRRGQMKVLKMKHSAKEFVYALLPMVWTREVLCTHSVSGRQSNAHKGRDPKPQLDTKKVDSLCNYVAEKFGSTPKEIRHLMTLKINNIIKCSAASKK